MYLSALDGNILTWLSSCHFWHYFILSFELLLTLLVLSCFCNTASEHCSHVFQTWARTTVNPIVHICCTCMKRHKSALKKDQLLACFQSVCLCFLICLTVFSGITDLLTNVVISMLILADIKVCLCFKARKALSTNHEPRCLHWLWCVLSMHPFSQCLYALGDVCNEALRFTTHFKTVPFAFCKIEMGGLACPPADLITGICLLLNSRTE